MVQVVQVQVKVNEQEEASDKWKEVLESEPGGLEGEAGLKEGRSEAVKPPSLLHELASVELMECPEHHQRCL